MYPVIRMFKEFAVHSRAGSLPVLGTHVSQHICWPWDLDLWMELNNGRTLTLFDLGRLPLARRTGLLRMLAAHRWGMTVAGVSVRYRRRVRVFDRFEVRSHALGWDQRFLYLEQSMWRGNDCTSHVLYRMAVTDVDGIVDTGRVAKALGVDTTSPPLPEWVLAWVNAEAKRPWPPEM